MNRNKQSKASLVEFLRSIKFDHIEASRPNVECKTHFAAFNPQARKHANSVEDRQLVRSAN